MLRAVHYVCFLIFPTLMFRAMSIEKCGEYELYGLLKVRVFSSLVCFIGISFSLFHFLSHASSAFSPIISFLTDLFLPSLPHSFPLI
jgi:hypothetical protein